MFEPSNLFHNNYMTCNMILHADSSGVLPDKISDTQAKHKIHSLFRFQYLQTRLYMLVAGYCHSVR